MSTSIPNEPTRASTSAVRNALNRAKAHAGTAAIAAVLAPLAATPAAAAPLSNITASTSTASGVTTFTYQVSTFSFYAIYEFELPELHANDFDLASFVGPSGWTVTQESASTFGTTGFKPGGPTAGAFLLFQTAVNGIAEGSSNFSLSTTVSGTLNANFTTQLGSPTGEGFQPYSTETIDPIAPGSVATTVVPEPPVTALLLGGLAAAAFGYARRRKP